MLIMTPRLSHVRSQVPNLNSALHAFQSSSSSFRVLHTLNARLSSTSPRTLLILDSSFNPPSRAHLALVTSLFKNASESTREGQKYPKPWRLLLLFSTHNADKAPSAATFEQRLAMMCVFAEDLLDTLCGGSSSAEESSSQISTEAEVEAARQPFDIPPIDVGVTTEPYYTNKSTAIEFSSPTYYPAPPNHPRHVHLCGFDTLTRVLNPKYYQSFTPPLSALDPYFSAGHGFRVMQRPDEEYGSAQQQDQFLFDLAGGAMRRAGGREEWAMKIDMVEGEAEIGVSSTRVRRAAKAGEWDEVRKLCTTGVTEWIKEQAIYEGDDRGAKMA